jgi:hypothetical protein
MRTSIILLVASVMLAGCATPEQRAAAMQAEMDRMMRVYGPACAKLGFAANTDPWRNCMLQLSTKDEIQRAGYYQSYPYYGRSYWGPYW